MNRAFKLLLIAVLFAVCGGAICVQQRLERRRESVPPNELYDVVWKQIRAIREGDAASAYQHVSMSFQEKFKIETFADLSRAEYPGLLRAERVEFGAVRFDAGRALVPVYFFMPDGDVIPCVYSLVNEGNSWKIDGARVMKRWPAGRRLSGMRA